jgi:calcineurin-like phosphoesterase family protein
MDRVYILGDVAINRRSISCVSRLNGRLVLVKGNHDIFKINDYLPFFDDIRSCVVQKDAEGNKVILSHIPIHPDCLGRFGTNIHGHLHQNKLDDSNYVCVSLEHISYAPIELHEALKLRGVRV